jgi:hypothetical protein
MANYKDIAKGCHDNYILDVAACDRDYFGAQRSACTQIASQQLRRRRAELSLSCGTEMLWRVIFRALIRPPSTAHQRALGQGAASNQLN